MASSMTGINKPRLRFGPYQVDLNSRELRKSGVRVKLSGQPFAILEALLDHPGQLVTREELRKRIWPENTFVDYGHGLNAAVNKLREALCDSADDPKYIETLTRRGYRFIAPVEDEDLVDSAPAAVTALPAQSEPVWKGPLVEDEWESTVPVKRQTLVRVSASLAALILASLGMTAVWFQRSATVREMEPRHKHTAEASEAEQKELREKQAAQNPVLSVGNAHGAANSVAPAPLVPPRPESQPAVRAEPSAVEPSAFGRAALLHLESLGRHLKLSEAHSLSENPAILRFDLAHATEANAVKRIVAGQDTIGGPQPSPDDKKLAFMQGRTDSMEIWVCNSDGSSPKRLTSMGRTGTPRWSPDGRSIVFDSDGRFGNSGIYIVSSNGGAVRPVVADQWNNSVPSWSRDGKYIYFASNRGEGWQGDQVWKVAAEGGEPMQTTRQGGFAAYESVDGQTVYYAKSRYENPEIWQVSAKGGTESRVTLLHPSTWASWAPTDKGILLLSEYSGETSELQYFDFATRSIHSLATLERASFWLSASANGASVWYSELTDYQAHQVFKASLY
jgi:Tol biopolymer transport system component/DNA-binding winged helix-turn-helix (wHTH) protein